MTSFRLLMLLFTIASMGWSPTDAEDLLAESGAVSGLTREPRHLRKKKLCRKYGICEGQGGFQGGLGGLQGGGFQGGYQPQPPISIAISQSQSGTNGAEGGHSSGFYPNNHQYNGGYPQQGFGGYPNHGGYGGYPNIGNYGGYPQQGGHRPGYFGNGQGSYNNQFNGNYYGPAGGFGGGGYGFRPNGPYFDEQADEEGGPHHGEGEHDEASSISSSGGYNDYNHGSGYQDDGQNFAVAGAFAVAGRKNN